jgi:DNA-binding NarL/FixJ family response regulator
MMPWDSGSLVHEAVLGLNIVSHSQLFCEGVAALLAHYLPHATCSAYADTELPCGLPLRTTQLVLVDGGGGLERTLRVIRAWRAAHPETPILTLELPDDASAMVACIEAGARGYTLRGAGSAEVVEALLLLLRGQVACSLEVTAQVFARLAERNAAGVAAQAVELTEREREVLAYLAADYSNQAIAERLTIEVRTVKHHVHNLLAKLKARHRWQAVSVARDQGLLSR